MMESNSVVGKNTHMFTHYHDLSFFSASTVPFFNVVFVLYGQDSLNPCRVRLDKTKVL